MKKNIVVARNSIVALKKIIKGQKFTKKNLTTKRPGNGISPIKFSTILGRKAKKDFVEDEIIKV